MTAARSPTAKSWLHPDSPAWPVVRSASMFAGLDERHFHLIAGELRCERYGKGQILFLQGDPAAAFFIVLEGWVNLSRDRSDGTRTVMKILGPGDSFAEALVGEGEVYPVCAEAASPLRVARCDTARFRALIAGNPGMALSMIAATFRQMRQLLDQIEHLKSWPIERRVAKALLDMCGPVREGACSFTMPVDQGLVAARLSISAPTFSRTLKKLGAIGVEAKYGRITIDDVARLAAVVAEGSDDG